MTTTTIMLTEKQKEDLRKLISDLEKCENDSNLDPTDILISTLEYINKELDLKAEGIAYTINENKVPTWLLIKTKNKEIEADLE